MAVTARMCDSAARARFNVRAWGARGALGRRRRDAVLEPQVDLQLLWQHGDVFEVSQVSHPRVFAVAVRAELDGIAAVGPRVEPTPVRLQNPRRLRVRGADAAAWVLEADVVAAAGRLYVPLEPEPLAQRDAVLAVEVPTR
jgi:hypothetical protein